MCEHLRTLMSRTDRALAAAGFDALVIHSGRPPTQFLDDQDYPYKVNPHFKAWVPIVDNPQCFAVYAPGSRLRVLFHQPNDYWHKPASLPEEPWTAAIDLTRNAGSGQCRRALDQARPGGLHRPQRVLPRRRAAIAESPRAARTPALRSGREDRLRARVHAPGERARRPRPCGRARGISSRSFRIRDPHAVFRPPARSARRRRPTTTSWPTMNTRRCCIISISIGARPARLRSFLIDAGAQFRGYASDITRTYAAAPGLFADLLGRLDGAQQRLCQEVVAGRDYREMHLTAHRILGDELQQIGLTKLPGQSALELGVTSVFFPHGIGHLLGLQVHDVGGIMGDLEGRRAKTARRSPVLAPHAHARTRRRGDHRARHLSSSIRCLQPRTRTSGAGISTGRWWTPCARTAASESKTTWPPRPRRPKI